MNKLFYSDAGSGSPPGVHIAPLGIPRSSCGNTSRRVVGLFDSAQAVYLPRPEIISSDVARAAIGMAGEGRSPHLVFRPFEQIRPLKGAYNIAHVSWGGGRLTDAPPARNPHPFLSQRAMLRTCQEVWAGSSHSARVYRENGVDNVKVIPCPVPCPGSLPDRAAADLLTTFGNLPSLSLSISFGINNIERHQRSIRPLAEQPALQDPGRRRLYLTVMHPGDFSQNTEKLLRGFAGFAQDHEGVVLLVKLVLEADEAGLAAVQQRSLLPQFSETTGLRSGQVIFISADLDEAEMTRLYRMADFYICLSLGEGQNLPLCEAMAQGVVPLSVAHTAMADYIDESTGIVVPSRADTILLPAANDEMDAHDCSETDYLAALERTARLEAPQLQQLRAAAHARALSFFSSAVVRQRILDQSDFDFSGYL